MSRTRTTRSCGWAAAVALVAGCSGTTTSGVIEPGDGSITLDWTVAGALVPEACGSISADATEIIVKDQAGGQVADLTPPCDDFSILVSLPPGTYTVDATLVDNAGRPVTFTMTLDGLEVVSGKNLAESVDFPLVSVL